MINLILAGMGAGLLVFCTLFIVSFITLVVITGIIHLVTVVYRSLFFEKPIPHRQQTAYPPFICI